MAQRATAEGGDGGSHRVWRDAADAGRPEIDEVGASEDPISAIGAEEEHGLRAKARREQKDGYDLLAFFRVLFDYRGYLDCFMQQIT